MSHVWLVESVDRLTFHRPKPHLSCQKCHKTVFVSKEDASMNTLWTNEDIPTRIAWDMAESDKDRPAVQNPKWRLLDFWSPRPRLRSWQIDDRFNRDISTRRSGLRGGAAGPTACRARVGAGLVGAVSDWCKLFFFFFCPPQCTLIESLFLFFFFWWPFGSIRCHASAKQRMRAHTSTLCFWSWYVGSLNVQFDVLYVVWIGKDPLAQFALLFQICGLHEAVVFVHRTSCTRWMWLDSCGASLQNFRRRENCGRLSCHAHSKMFDGRPAADALLLFIVERRLSSVLPAHESPRLGNGLTFILPWDRFKWSSILRLTSGFHAQRGQLPREREREKKES